jgi:ABC-type iron transport system FetAB permease component
MRSIDALYLLFAVAHPVSELVGRTNLRTFMNKAYYRTDREDFPINKLKGIAGSWLVLALLVAPLLASLFFATDSGVVEFFWYLAFGVVLADLIQHATHSVARPRDPAPWVHLITILGVLVLLLLIVAPGRDVLQTHYLLPLLLGTLIIFGNWFNNSRIANLGGGVSTGQVVKP